MISATILYDLQRYYSDNVAITIEMQQCYRDNAAKYSIIFCLHARRGVRVPGAGAGAAPGAEIMTNGHASFSRMPHDCCCPA